MPQPLGVLILHGFTGSRATVAPVIPQAEALGLPWLLPQLRGHWSKPEDLLGVTYTDMFEDAKAALNELQTSVARVAVVGLSVGALLALNLAIERPDDIESLVVLAPALRYVHPLTRVSALLARFIKMWPKSDLDAFTDRSLASRAGNYTHMSTAAFVSVYRAGQRIEMSLPKVAAPLLVLGARQDKIIQPRCAQIVYDHTGSTSKELIWFDRSGHEMLLDCEADAVVARIGIFFKQRLAAYR